MTLLRARAQADLALYCRTMAQPDGWKGCLRIEQDWALDGYPPEVVTTVLHLVSQGEEFGRAEDIALGNTEENGT